MERSIEQEACGDKGAPVYIDSDIINTVLRKKAKALIPEGEQNWYAEYVLNLPPATLSAYLNGTRAFPASLVVAMDKAFHKRELLEVLIDLENSGPATHKPLDPRTLQKMFVLALKEEGTFNSMLAQGIMDSFEGPDELSQLARETAKLQHFLAAIQERIQESIDRAKASQVLRRQA